MNPKLPEEESIVKEKVFVSTVHKAKGLEFENVIVFGCVDGVYPFFASDVEIDTSSGSLQAIVIQGKFKFLGILGREDDIVIPWNEISVIGKETILVNTDPDIYSRFLKSNRY